MTDHEPAADETAALRARISAFSAASLRISASLDLETVVNEVVDSVRALTGASLGGITTIDDAGVPPGLRHFGLHQQGKETGAVGVERDRFRQGALVEKL